MAESVKLRPVEESDLKQLVRLAWDPSATGEYQWFRFRMNRARETERRWHDDGLTGDESSFLTVAAGEAGEEACAGWVSWRRISPTTFEIGKNRDRQHRGAASARAGRVPPRGRAPGRRHPRRPVARRRHVRPAAGRLARAWREPGLCSAVRLIPAGR